MKKILLILLMIFSKNLFGFYGTNAVFAPRYAKTPFLYSNLSYDPAVICSGLQYCGDIQDYGGFAPGEPQPGTGNVYLECICQK